jgi:hypothetical protein
VISDQSMYSEPMRRLHPHAVRPVRGMAAFLLTIFFVLLPAVQCAPHGSCFTSTADGHQHARTDAGHSATFSSFPPSTGVERLFSYPALIAPPPMADLSLSARSQTDGGESLVWLLGATTARPRAPPSLTL